MQFILGIIALLPLLSNGGYIQLKSVTDDLIAGYYIPQRESPFKIRFQVDIEDKVISSITEMIAENPPVHEVITTLKVPLNDKNNIKIDNMQDRIVEAARETQAVLSALDLPLGRGDYSDIYEDFTREFAIIFHEQKTQVYYSIVYHESIVKAANRISNGAETKDEICDIPDDYTKGMEPFYCVQDFQQAQLPGKRETQRVLVKRYGWWRRRRYG